MKKMFVIAAVLAFSGCKSECVQICDAYVANSTEYCHDKVGHLCRPDCRVPAGDGEPMTHVTYDEVMAICAAEQLQIPREPCYTKCEAEPAFKAFLAARISRAPILR